MDVLIAIDELDDAVHVDRRPTLLRFGPPRIQRERYDALVGRIVDGLAALRIAHDPPIAALVERLRAVSAGADGRRLPLDREAVYDVLDGLRASIPDSLRASRGTPPAP